MFSSLVRSLAFLFYATLLIASGAYSVLAQTNTHNISAGYIRVVQNDISNTTDSVTVSLALSVNGFDIRDGSSRGDFFIQAGDECTDDLTNGIVMSCVAENGRDNGEAAYVGTNYCTSTVDYSRTGVSAGGYYVSTFNAPTGAEYNINVAAAFFPFTNFFGGLARNSGTTNGGANDLFTGSPGLVLGTHFIDNGSGVSTVNLTGFGLDSRTNAVLLVTHGKNEDNYASSMVNSNNGTWTVYIKDNGTDAGSHEQDPVAFVCIPKTNTTVVSGRFSSDGTRLMYSGNSPEWTVVNTATGIWKLTINNQSPSTGVLIISAEGGFSQNQDNIVSYQADTNGWIIQSRDLPGSPPGLQTPAGEPVASFVFIPAAANVVNLSPVEGAQGLTRYPALQAAISNAGPSSATVRFYGRPANANNSGDFELIALPDTQFYTDSAHGAQPEMFYAQTEWVITNRVPRNIVYVAGEGDIVDHGDNNGGNPFNEWKVATNALYRLENPTRTLLAQGIPYGTAVGNHDQSPNGAATGTTTYYNTYFGVNHFAGKNYYAGHYGTTNNNHFDFFTAGGMDFIVLYFEYDSSANPAVLSWGSSVLTTYNNRRAIIVTHNFGNTSTPVTFSTQGQAIYNMAKTHTNVFMMLAGHVTGQGQRTDTYQGHTIRTFVSDYQGWTNGGDGFLRVITFSPANNQVIFQTFSPWTGEWLTDSDSEFYFTYNMDHLAPTNTPYALLGTVTNVPPGGVASIGWPGLNYGITYEWYAELTGGNGDVTSAEPSRFTVGGNVAPVATNSALTVYGDMATNLTLHASDANGDPITFSTNTLPAHGLNLNFNPTNGTLTYMPAYGYRGSDRFIFSASDGSLSASGLSVNMTIVSPPDSNSNGLPDWWETFYGISNPAADADGDGRNNLDEYVENTNPTNGASLFRITSASRAANGPVTLTWASVGGVRYRVQYSNGGVGGVLDGTFVDVPRSLSVEMDSSPYGTASTKTFTDDFTLTGGPPANGARYYRVKITQ